jgi:arylsulfatase A
MKRIKLILRKFSATFCLNLGFFLLFPNLAILSDANEKPNIVLVLVDNLGYGDFGFAGNMDVRTPNIDKFAREGIQFTRFYANPMCSPTRASLMTGRYFYRTGVIHTSRGGAKMHGDEVTIAEYLDKAGYATGLFGKWHLGDNYPMRQQDQGFKQVLSYKNSRIGQVPDQPNTYFHPKLYHNGKRIQAEGYCTDVFTDAAIDFIKQNRDRPFFAYIPYNAAHIDDEKVVGLLVDRKYSDPYEKMGYSEKTAKVWGMATNVDENFARLLVKLEELKIRDNTIVIFASEDGSGMAQKFIGFRTGMGDTLHGTNIGGIYEGDIRVPFLVQWPAYFKGGKKVNQIASHIDLLPTLLDACDLQIPERPVIDGISLLPLLKGEEENWKERMLFFQCHRGLTPQKYQHCVVVSRQYKMLGYPNTFNEENLQISLQDPYLELYDLLEDPGEENNISDKHPVTLKLLRIAYDFWFEDVKSTRQFTPGWIHIGSEIENPTYLCRYQDAVYYNGEPTGWPVIVEQAGKYEIEIKKEAIQEKGRLFVKIDNELVSKQLKEGTNKETFYIPKGQFKLNIWFKKDGELYYNPRGAEDTIGDVIIRRL